MATNGHMYQSLTPPPPQVPDAGQCCRGRAHPGVSGAPATAIPCSLERPLRVPPALASLRVGERRRSPARRRRPVPSPAARAPPDGRPTARPDRAPAAWTSRCCAPPPSLASSARAHVPSVCAFLVTRPAEPCRRVALAPHPHPTAPKAEGQRAHSHPLKTLSPSGFGQAMQMVYP